MKKIKPVFLILSAIIMLFFCAAAPENPNLGDSVWIDDCNSPDIKFYQESEDIVHLVNGTDYYQLDSSGQVLNYTQVPENIRCFRLSGKNLFMIYDTGNTAGIQILDTDDLTVSEGFTLSVPFYDIQFITCDSYGKVYYCPYSSPAAIYIEGMDTSPQMLSLNSYIISMDIWGDSLFLYSDGKITEYNIAEGLSDGTSVVSTDNIPAHYICNNIYISTKGYFCFSDGNIILKTKLNPAIYAQPYPEPILHSCDGSFMAFSENGSSVRYADMSGNIMCEYNFDSTILGMSPNSVIFYDGGSIYYSHFDNIQPNNPFPEHWDVQGEFLMVDAGTTIPQVIDGTPFTVLRNNQKVSSGLCKTCDIVFFEEKCLTIVVRYDINNNGQVNTADLKLLEDYLLDDVQLVPAQVQAADASCNGVLGTEDLVLILRNIASNEISKDQK